MTAFIPLLGRLIEQTTVTHATGQLQGILSVSSKSSRKLTEQPDLIDSSVVIYQFRVLSPLSALGIAAQDTVKIAQTASKLVAVGDVLRIISVIASPYKIVVDKTGWTILLISNTLRYMP
jgi:hypothetical protein